MHNSLAVLVHPMIPLQVHCYHPHRPQRMIKPIKMMWKDAIEYERRKEIIKPNLPSIYSTAILVVGMTVIMMMTVAVVHVSRGMIVYQPVGQHLIDCVIKSISE